MRESFIRWNILNYLFQPFNLNLNFSQKSPQKLSTALNHSLFARRISAICCSINLLNVKLSKDNYKMALRYRTVASYGFDSEDFTLEIIKTTTIIIIIISITGFQTQSSCLPSRRGHNSPCCALRRNSFEEFTEMCIFQLFLGKISADETRLGAPQGLLLRVWPLNVV